MPRGGVETMIGHWAQLLEGLQASPQEFYAAVETSVKTREIPGCRLSRVDWPEGSLISAKRQYLRAERGEYVIDICGAPFGKGFFVSSWLCGPPPDLWKAVAMAAGSFVLLGILQLGNSSIAKAFLSILDVIFFLGVVGLGIVRPLLFPPLPTYYRVDTAEMFYRAVQKALGEVIDGLSNAQGVRLLTEDERKPIMRGLGR